MKQFLYTISLLLLLGACTDETYTDTLSAGGGKPGKLVPVKLSLSIEPLQSPLDAGTKAGDGVVSSTEVCKGMEISLVKTPVTRAADMSEIVNFCVFQFNGTEQTSTLTKKLFVTGNSVKEVKLEPSEGTKKNRIIVIANAEESAFSAMNDAQSGLSPTSTLAEFNNLGINSGKPDFPLFKPSEVSDASPRIIWSGSADMIVSTNAQANIRLYRSIAQVTVNLKLGKKMQDRNYTDWSSQFMGIPKKSYFHAMGRTPAFPGGNADNYSSYSQNPIEWNKNSDGIVKFSISEYLPVNLHHSVPFTTPDKRATNAPHNSTYLQIMGLQMAGTGTETETNNSSIVRSVIYQIHLGSNFTDDYSISPNFQYTYEITITDENDDDSRVVKFIPGYFGGELKTLDKDYNLTGTSTAVIWRYEKRIEVYIKDVGDVGVWANEGASIPTNSFIDGRANTEQFLDKTADYPAVKKCIELNGKDVTSSSLTWYMPSFGQSLAIYVAGSSTLKTLPDATYWTSSTNGTNAWSTKIWTGKSVGENLKTGQCRLRCIKDLTSGNMMQ